MGIKTIETIGLQLLCLVYTNVGLSQPPPHSSTAPAPNLKLNPPAVTNQATIPFNIPALTVSVKQFGAIGDGIADDTKAIQTTIDAVVAKGGGTVFFPVGTYRVLIQPQKARALTIHKTITLKGERTQKSVIKLGDRQGNYHAILAGAGLSSDLSNFSLQQLTIDANATANPIASEQSFKGDQDRFILRIYVGRNLHIEQCRFTNIKNINVLTLNNDQAVSDIVIQNNRFDGIGGGSFDHDHSTIYVHGKRSLIAHNTFVSAHGSGTYGARTAIEIHGDAHQVLNNQISGYTFGINATGFASRSREQRIEGNTITGAHSGILLWADLFEGQQVEGQQVEGQQVEGQQAVAGLENLTIHHNQIDIDVIGWRKLWGDSPNQGIALEANSDASIQGLKITQNKIEFHHFKDGGRRTDNLAAGVVLWRYKAPNVSSSNIAIAQNEIRNPLAAGVYIAMPIQHLDITQNTIFNVGQGKYPFHPHYRSGLLIGANRVSMQIEHNQFIDNQPQATMTTGMLWQGTCAQKCSQRENRMVLRPSAKVPLLIQTP
jgi:hypothetical protein